MMNNRAIHLLAIVIALLALSGCRSSSIDIGLRLDRYAPKIDPVKYQQYAGQQICLSNIGNDAQNTTIFYYFSPDGSARYSFYAADGDSGQIIQSYYWYAYKKAFTQIGITVANDCTLINQKELWIIFQSFNDQELKLRATTYKNTIPVYQKDITVTMPPYGTPPDPGMLKQRAYEMTDLTITTLLDDPGLQDALLK
jgi:hypothetical protein